MQNAQLYSVYNDVQKKDGEMILLEFGSYLKWSENENVLDVGCGPGDVSTQVLLPQLPNSAYLVGVDISSNMVEFANEKYGSDKVKFKTLDIATKNITHYFPERHFSKIFSCHCLHWVQDQTQLGRNLFSLLRPGGEFLAVMTPSSQLFLALKLLSSYGQFKEYCQDIDHVIPPLYYSENPAEDFRKTLIEQGLEVVTCEQRLNPISYPNLDTMTRAFEAFNPFVNKMPGAVKEEYLYCFEQLVKQRIPVSESGEIHLQNPILVVFARRPLQTWALSKPSHSCAGMC